MAKEKTTKTAKKTKSKRKSSKNKKPTSNFAKLLKGSFVLGAIAFLLVTIYVIYCYIALPDISGALSKTRQPSTTIIAENGQTIKSFGSVYSEVVHTNEIPLYFKEALISTEDRRFYEHNGFDPKSFTRAMLVNLKQMRYAQGGSTITQQVAKNLFLTPQKNIKRKVQELLMAFWLEDNFSKEQILTLYLNRVYMGAGTYGIEAASQKFFQKSSRDVNPLEAAILVGVLKAPSRYNPIASKERALSRAKTVLQNMVDNNIITPKQKQAADNMTIGPKVSQTIDSGRYFADWVYDEVNAYIGERDMDINVYTTLDKDIQLHAEEVLKKAIEDNKDKNVTNGAVVVMSKNGAIRAMVGGVNYEKSQFNRATQALRQPGSAFKTFVYLSALEQGYMPDSTLSDTPSSFGNWTPQNYDKKYYGEVSLTNAFAKSLNIATVSLSESISRQHTINLAHKMGITTPIPNLASIALGALEVKIIDMAVAYCAIANGGYASWPYSITDIYNNQGYEVYRRIQDEKIAIIDKKDVDEITNMLTEVIKNGTGKNAKLPFFAAGKTGTSQDFRDAWFVGFSNNYVAAVWVGNDNDSSMKSVGGGGIPAKIWKEIMLKAETNYK